MKTLDERINAALDRAIARLDTSGDCWLWPGSTNGRGYGKLSIKTGEGRRSIDRYLHRLMYEREHGPIEPGMEIDHTCFVRNCANPAHLEMVRRKENVRRQMARITHCPQGHEYDEENTRINTDGRRDCRACDRERARIKRGTLPENVRGPYQRR